MRAISPISKYSIQLIESIPKRGMDKSGTVVEYTDKKPVIAEFSRGGLTEWEQLDALESFDFSGLPEGVNPLSRVSVYDTEAAVASVADPREREALQGLIEQRLTHLQTIFPSEFRIIEKPAANKPWPTFDETPLEDTKTDDGKDVVPGILSLQQLTGQSPESIRLYEVENRNRPEVVQAMEDLEAEALEGVKDEGISVAL